MKVIDVITIVNDDTDVQVISQETGEILTAYDGKNSIDEQFNNEEVVGIEVDSYGTLIVVVK